MPTTQSSRTSVMLHESADGISKDRRNFLNILPVALAAASFPFADAANANEQFSMYQDTNMGFEIKTPSGWEKSEQALADRRRIVLFVDNNGDGSDKDLMFVAYTPVRDDFT